MPNASRVYQQQAERLFQNQRPQPAPTQLVEFYLDGTTRHVIHCVHSGETSSGSQSIIEEEGGSSSISWLDGATVTASSTSTSSASTADDDEFPQRVAELFDTTGFPEFPLGFGRVIFNVSVDEGEPVVETVEERQQRIARNEDRARRRTAQAQAQAQAPPQPEGVGRDADAAADDAQVAKQDSPPPPGPTGREEGCSPAI